MLGGDDYNRDFHSPAYCVVTSPHTTSCVKQPTALVACKGCHMVITINTAA